ncbi:MAG TPA: MarC family protein [Saprospiraceae bacterium]|nr:MarC family protein [Saprospiraceae bacterium]
MFSINAILTTSLILFSVIDIIGSLPVILDMKQKGVRIHPVTSTIAAGVMMIAFLFFGTAILGLFGLKVSSFALAGSLIIFFIGLEMVLGIRFFRDNEEKGATGSIVPVAFPILAGAGTLTTVISLRASFSIPNIIMAILINLVLIYMVLRSTGWIERKMPAPVKSTLRKIFGILLIAIAVQMFQSNW